MDPIEIAPPHRQLRFVSGSGRHAAARRRHAALALAVALAASAIGWTRAAAAAESWAGAMIGPDGRDGIRLVLHDDGAAGEGAPTGERAPAARDDDRDAGAAAPSGGQLDVPGVGWFALAVGEVSREDASLSFVARTPGGPLRFTGERTGDVVRGTVTSPGGEGRFHLSRVAPLRPADLDGLAGAYRTDGQHLFLVLPRSRGGLRIGEWAAARFETAFPLDTDTLFFPGGEEPGRTSDRRVVFLRGEGGRVRGLALREGAETLARASLTDDFTIERLDVDAGGAVLQALLLTPFGPGPHPAIVFGHEAGHDPRDSAYALLHAVPFLQSGVAVVLYDKRGTGGSTGDWRTADLDALTRDMLAVHEAVRARRRIRSHQVGLWGQGESASWIAPRAAARSDDVAFLVALSPTCGTPVEQERHRLATLLAESGAPDEHVAAAVRWHEEVSGLLASGAGWETIADAWGRVADRPWSAALGPPPEGPHDARIARWRRELHEDGRDDWRRVDCPALIALGEGDAWVDVPRTLERLDAAAKASENPDVVVQVYAAPAGHVIGTPDTPGWFELVTAWTADQLAATDG